MKQKRCDLPENVLSESIGIKKMFARFERRVRLWGLIAARGIYMWRRMYEKTESKRRIYFLGVAVFLCMLLS